MYLVGLDVINNHDLYQEVYPGYFHSQTISNGLVAFSDGVEVHNPNEKIAISCVIICIFGVAVNWSYKTQPEYAAHSIESEF